MNPQSEQHTTAVKPQASSYHFILTVQKPTRSGYAVSSFHGTYTPPPGSTRYDAYEEIRAEHDRLNPDTAGYAVLFFSLEHNEL